MSASGGKGSLRRQPPVSLGPHSRVRVAGEDGGREQEGSMCREIRTLFKFAPPATDAEIRASAVQFVRKLSGFAKPSKANEAAFERAVEEISTAARRLLDSLETARPPREREVEARKARARSAERFARRAQASSPPRATGRARPE
jgi:hypothetical protein